MTHTCDGCGRDYRGRAGRPPRLCARCRSHGTPSAHGRPPEEDRRRVPDDLERHFLDCLDRGSSYEDGVYRED